VSARDRILLSVIAALAVVAAFWFVALAPKRKEIVAADAALAAQQQRLDAARTLVANAEAAKRRYAADYAEIARLGKAIPVDDDTASIVYALQSVADGAKVRVDSVKLNASGSTATAQTTPSAAASGASDTTGASAGGATGAPATQVGAASLPPGATVGTAGLATLPFNFVFEGRYLDMQRFLTRVNGFVRLQGGRIVVRGRLLTIDGISLLTSPDTKGIVKATLAATAYLAPPASTPGAAPAGSAGATDPSPGSVSTAPSNTSSAVTGFSAP
jgi:Tfp pilus assembly protein PilO